MTSNAIDMELENAVFLIIPVQFSVVRIVILVIQFSNTVQNTSYFVMYMFFSIDFAGFCKIRLIAQSCAILGQFREIAKFQKTWLKDNQQQGTLLSILNKFSLKLGKVII